MRSFNRPLSLLALALIASFFVSNAHSLIRRSRILSKKNQETKSNNTESLKSNNQSWRNSHISYGQNGRGQVQIMNRPLNNGEFYDGRHSNSSLQYDPNRQNEFHHYAVHQNSSVDSSSSQNKSQTKENHVVINNQATMLRKYTKKQPVDLESFSSKSQSNLSPSQSMIKAQIKKKTTRNKASSKIFGTQESIDMENSQSSHQSPIVIQKKSTSNTLQGNGHHNLNYGSEMKKISPLQSNESKSNRSIEHINHLLKHEVKNQMVQANQLRKNKKHQKIPSISISSEKSKENSSSSNKVLISNLDSGNRLNLNKKDKGRVSNDLDSSKILNAPSQNISDTKTMSQKSGNKTLPNIAEQIDEEQIILPNPEMKYENSIKVEGSSDIDEDTMFGQSVSLENGTVVGSLHRIPEGTWRPNRIIANMIYIFLVVSGLYCCFLGFRFFKLTMILLGLDLSYYFVILFLSEFDIYDAENVGHQLGVFFGSLVLGFAISIIAYLYRGSQFIIIGVTIGSMVSVFVAQFFIDFEDNNDKIMILIIYLASSLVFSIAAYASQHSTLIWGTVIVGSILATINFGVLLNDFKSFEHREKLPADRYSDCINYLIANAILICLGLIFQFYMKNKIISRLKQQDAEEDSDMYSVRATTFL